jgi:hypothetical protein
MEQLAASVMLMCMKAECWTVAAVGMCCGLLLLLLLTWLALRENDEASEREASRSRFSFLARDTSSALSSASSSGIPPVDVMRLVTSSNTDIHPLAPAFLALAN